jgi:diacylglycerol kinase family enzyme
MRRQPLEIISLQSTSGPGLADAMQSALSLLAPGGILAAAGGDGTIGLAAAMAAKADRVLAILPTGTGNDVARSVGLPLNPEEAVALVADGEVTRMDLEITEVGMFTHAATIGMTAEFARRVRDIKGWRRPTEDGSASRCPAPPSTMGCLKSS